MRHISLLLLLLSCATASAQDSKPGPYQEGLHYTRIEGAPAATGSGPLQVEEAFSYLCSHCNTFEPYVNAWKRRLPEGVEFSRIPVVFGRSSWELYARGYVTAQMLNIGDEAHNAMMDRLWKEKKIMRSMDELAGFYSEFGVDKDKFLATARSFAVDSRLKKDQRKVQDYGITGTPSLVFDGRFRIAANAAVPSFEVMLDVVDFLIQQESAAGSQQVSAAAD
jgi:thiol:disulfide interchange protein DsbA